MSNLSNFASAGKAFANVMNKEGNDSAKKTRKDMNKTESKTITARRRSSLATASLSTRNSADEPWTNPLLLLRKQPPNLQFRRGLLPFDLGLSVRFLSVRLPKQKRAVTTPNLILPNPNPHPWFGKHLENGWADFSTSNSFSNSSWEYRVLFASPNRMAKAVKAATSPGKGAQGTHSVKVQKNNVSDSSEGSVRSALLGSPLVRHVRQRSKAETPAQNPGNMSHITEADSDDDEDYVEIMLAPIAAPGAPTPAMPRLQTMRNRSRFVPATPSKPLLPIHFEPPRQPRLNTKIVLPSSDQTLHQQSVPQVSRLAVSPTMHLTVSPTIGSLTIRFANNSSHQQPVSPMILHTNERSVSPTILHTNDPSHQQSVSPTIRLAVSPTIYLTHNPSRQ
ncbi:hypothetical protein GG344DRAFT_81523 [Lentinula edodes]|nr:hypothetical protein GG344DRAFT_81523 [Lentinula edodes]